MNTPCSVSPLIKNVLNLKSHFKLKQISSTIDAVVNASCLPQPKPHMYLFQTLDISKTVTKLTFTSLIFFGIWSRLLTNQPSRPLAKLRTACVKEAEKQWILHYLLAQRLNLSNRPHFLSIYRHNNPHRMLEEHNTSCKSQAREVTYYNNTLQWGLHNYKYLELVATHQEWGFQPVSDKEDDHMLWQM